MLTSNSMHQILDGAKSPSFLPIVQIISIKTASGLSRLVISDSRFCCQALYSSETPENFDQFDIVQLQDYNVGIMKEIKLIIIKKLSKQQPYFEVIGNPAPLEQKVEQVQLANIVYELRETAPQDNSNTDDSDYAPICALSAASTEWTIKVRVIEKSSVRTWENARSKGKLFSCVFTDKKGDQIKGTFFNTAVDLFFEFIEPMKVYAISGGNVKVSNKTYSCVSDLEISFDKNTVMKKLPDDPLIAKHSFNFHFIDYLPKLSVNTLVDVCGMVCDMKELVKFTTKNGRETSKRDLVVSDHTGCSIGITLWGEIAEMPEFSLLNVREKPILCFKNLKIGDYNKISLNSDISTVIYFETSAIAQAEFLKDWKSKTDRLDPSTPLTERKEREAVFRTTAEIKSEWTNLLISKKTEMFRIIGVLGLIQLSDEKPIWYQACTRNGCKKKVVNDSLGTYHCESCGLVSDSCEYRYICTLIISDLSGLIYTTAFDEVMTALLNISARELHDLYLSDPAKAEDLVFSVSGRFINAVISARDSDNRERYKFTVKKLEDFNSRIQTQTLIKEILSLV